MRLIGMMDSPYVRRVAVSLRCLQIPFSHESVSVFSQFDEFAGTNPVVKAATLVTDNRIVLMDSTLIIEYLERLAAPERRLTPSNLEEMLRAQRLVGLALAACEKTVQIVYERSLRPAEKYHEPWIERVRYQLLAAYGLLEAETHSIKGWLFGARPLQADITVGVAWHFAREAVPDIILPDDFPRLSEFSARAENTAEFLTCRPT